MMMLQNSGTESDATLKSHLLQIFLKVLFAVGPRVLSIPVGSLCSNGG